MARSQSLPTAKTQLPAETPGKKMSGAPEGALALPTIPIPAALVKATTTTEPLYPRTPGCDVAVTFVRVLFALAVQISDVPPWALLRCTSVQLRPPPDTVAVCVPGHGPSYPTKATSRADGVVVENAGVVMMSLPSRKTVASIVIVCAGCELSTVTVTGDEVPVRLNESVAAAVRVCWPSATVRVSQGIRNGGADSAAPTGTPSTKNCTPVIGAALAT